MGCWSILRRIHDAVILKLCSVTEASRRMEEAQQVSDDRARQQHPQVSTATETNRKVLRLDLSAIQVSSDSTVFQWSYNVMHVYNEIYALKAV